MPASSSRKPRLIFVNRFYRPDEPATAQLLTDLAETLAELGHEVIVIARRPGEATPREETWRGVKILRVRCTRRPGGGLVNKAVDFASFYGGAMGKLFGVARPGDSLVSLTDPPLLGIGVGLVAWLRRARFFHWVQDIYPELAIELAGQRWLRMWRPLRDAAWRKAEGCVTLGQDMAAVLRAAGVPAGRISVVPNWAPSGLVSFPVASPNQLRADWGLSGKFVIAYSGNFGRVHDLLPVLSLAKALQDDPRIAVVLIGDGAQRGVLEAEVAGQRLTNVSFRPPQPRSCLGETLAVGDVHLVTLRAGCERLVFPSKLYGIAAIGRPVIFFGPVQCDVARTIAHHGFGYAFERDNIPAAASCLRALSRDSTACAGLSEAALQFSARSGGVDAAARQWNEILAPHGSLPLDSLPHKRPSVAS